MAVLCLISLKLKSVSFPSQESALIVQIQQSDSQPYVTLSPPSTTKPTKRTAPDSKPPPSPKRPRLSSNSSPDLEYIGTTHEQLGANIDLSLPPDEWKLAAIQILGGDIVPQIRDSVLGDGNCLFWAISKEITGKEENHIAIHLTALGYLRENPSLISYGDPTLNIDSCAEPMRQVQLQEEPVSRYISTHHMDTCGWGTDFEIMLLASLLTIQIFSFSTHGESRQWVCYAPGFTRNRSACPHGLYVYNLTNYHYDRVIPVLRPRVTHSMLVKCVVAQFVRG